ncbi:glycosyltransferase family 39 protein [Kordia sp. YSTF-M3]|uniref:Glycosyltransferase family 39 protein n=1 Tax=Kordia aestuariivivens TaxID=2759037 RepID=A0ABR7Q8M7_9FLAO|nr:phospholipid carrier-dependent glycosyltransferase [Kordia aestuariivivens]MBC8754793.1 glycosyltransferase family 39 protein [Kordia aestuariivivens]
MINTIASNPRLIRVTYVLLLIVSYFTIYNTIFDEKVSLVGDNASYYILGNSIANGDGYTNIQHSEKEAHYHYPPGYPVVIAAVVKVFSNDIITIKKLNGAFLLGAILLLFFIVKRLTENDHIAFSVSFITLLNYYILGYATIMMSEIPFLFFSLLCVLVFLKIDFSKPIFKNWLFFLLLICLSFSFYIRSVALALFVSMVCFLCFKKQWRYVVGLIGGFIVLYLPWMLRNSDAGNTYVSQLFLKNPYQPEQGSIGFSDLIERISINFGRYITKEIPSGMLSSNEVVYTDASAPITEWLLGFLLIIGIVFGIYKLQKFRTFILLYVLAFFALLMIWPYIWYGTRFLVPLIPLLIFLFIFGMISLLKWLQEKIIPKQLKHFTTITTVVLLSFWAFMYGSNSVSKLKDRAKGDYGDNYKNYFALADWVNKNADDASITAVRKEGLFYLFSKKNVTTYQKTLDKEAQLAYLKNKNVDYVVVEQLGFSSTSKYLVPVIDRYPNKFKTIKQLQNPNTYLMQFLPELGYSGAWKDGKRNGYGTYVWEDGQKYIGYWKNDVRHGEGAVSFATGERLEGVWTDGKLNGEVIKKTKNDVIIERSIYKNNVKIEVINEAN